VSEPEMREMPGGFVAIRSGPPRQHYDRFLGVVTLPDWRVFKRCEDCGAAATHAHHPGCPRATPHVQPTEVSGHPGESR
jgi:hypothetical protein